MAAGGPTDKTPQSPETPLTHRQKIMMEMDTVMGNFQKDLELMTGPVAEILKALAKNPTVKEEERENATKILEAIESLKKVSLAHQHFLAMRAKEGYSPATEKAYLQFADATQKYIDLYNGYNLPSLTVPSVTKEIGEIARKLDISSLLIVPVQYPPRVKLLMEDLKRKTAEGEPDFKQVQQFCSTAERVGRAINESQRVDPAMLIKQKDIRIKLPLKENKEMVGIRLKEVVNTFDGQWKLIKKSHKATGEEGITTGRRIKNLFQARTEYIIKNEHGQAEFRINVYPTYVSVKQISGRVGRTSYFEQLEQLQQIVKVVNVVGRQIPTVSSQELEGLAVMTELGLKDKNFTPYKVGKKEAAVVAQARERLNKQREASLDNKKIIVPTTQFNLKNTGHVVVLDYFNADPTATVSRYERASGGQVLELESAEMKKRFEAVIQNGFVPELRNVYGDDSRKRNQGKFRGVIEIGTLDPLIAIKQYEAVLAAGFTPQFTPEAKAKVRVYVKEHAKMNPEERQILIGSPGGDASHSDGAIMFERMQKAISDGFFVDITMQPEWTAHFKKQPGARLIDITHFDPAQQIQMAKQLARLGVNPGLSAEATGMEIPIEAATPKQALQIFGNLINHGYKPVLEQATKAELERLMKAENTNVFELQITLTEQHPKALLERIKHCFANGLTVQLQDKQKAELKKYFEKHGNKLGVILIDGHHAPTVHANIALANQLGMKIECTQAAKEANTRPELLEPIEVKVVNKKDKSHNFIPDIEKTLEKAINLAQSGYKVVLPEDVHRYLEGISAQAEQLQGQAKKRGFLGLVPQKARDAKIQLHHVVLFEEFKRAGLLSPAMVAQPTPAGSPAVLVSAPPPVTHLARRQSDMGAAGAPSAQPAAKEEEKPAGGHFKKNK